MAMKSVLVLSLLAVVPAMKLVTKRVSVHDARGQILDSLDARRADLTDARGQILDARRTEANATRTKVPSCECKSFAQVYAEEQAFCGRANELYFLSKNGFSAAYAATEPITGLPHKMCYDFFKNFKTPTCLNIDPYASPGDDKAGKQWCYVANDCPDLNGGGYATNRAGFAQGAWHNLESVSMLAWKICDPDEPDTQASSVLTVPEVKGMAEYSDVSFSHMLRHTFPSVSIEWGYAKYLWQLINDNYVPGGVTDIDTMVDAVPDIGSVWGKDIEEKHAILRAVAKSKKCTILDTVDSGDMFHVVCGRSAYKVIRVPLANMAYLGGHFGREYSVTCIFGCSFPEPRDAVDLETM